MPLATGTDAEVRQKVNNMVAASSSSQVRMPFGL